MVSNRTAIWVFLPFALLASERPAAAAPPDDISLKGLPIEFPGKEGGYTADPYLLVAGKLRAAGKDKAVAVLRAGAKEQGDVGHAVLYLCRMLFTAKPKAEFRPPLIGRPDYLGGTKPSDWPLDPIEIVDGVPFLVAWGYILGGLPESPEEYLDYCLKECVWGAAEFKPRTAAAKQRALDALLASKKWTRPLTDEEKGWLKAQIK